MSFPSPVSTYAPAPGSHGAQGLAHLMAAHPALVSGGELAELLDVDSKNVFQAMRKCVDYGLVRVEKQGRTNMYGITGLATAQVSEASPEQLRAIAKRAVIQMRAATKSSVELASLCSCTAQEIDTALSTLVTEGKLIRGDVIRGGQPMFDYRWGSTYVPHDADFDGPTASATPLPLVSAVAEPKAKTSTTVNNPASPWRLPGSLQLPGTPDLKPRDALAAGAELGKKTPAAPVQKAVEQKPEQVDPQTFQPKVPDFKTRDADIMLGWQVKTPAGPEVPEPDDFGLVGPLLGPLLVETEDGIVCCIDSNGQLEIEMGLDAIVSLRPDQALRLKRFLSNTSILEELAAGGAL